MAKKQASSLKYPKREPFHAFRLSRLLFKTCAAAEIGDEAGRNAVLLVICVALQEDAKRYSGPVTFWNNQLLSILNIRKAHTLIKVRDAAVSAGWLHYEGGGKSRAGRYWTIIPDRYAEFDDNPCDESDQFSMPLNGINEGVDGEDIESQMPSSGINNQESMPLNGIRENGLMPLNGTGRGINRGINRGIHSTLTLNPIPKETPLPPKGGSLAIESEFISAWNKAAGVIHVRGDRLTDKRRKALQARVADPAWDWRAAMGKFPLRLFASDPNGWKPDADWFLKPDSVNKILEGKYDWEKKDGTTPRTGQLGGSALGNQGEAIAKSNPGEFAKFGTRVRTSTSQGGAERSGYPQSGSGID